MRLKIFWITLNNILLQNQERPIVLFKSCVAIHTINLLFWLKTEVNKFIFPVEFPYKALP